MITLANKIIEQMENESLTPREAWVNLEEIKDTLSPQQYKEFSSYIEEYLWDESQDSEPEIDELIFQDYQRVNVDWDEEYRGDEEWASPTDVLEE